MTEYLTVKEVAEITGVSVQAIYKRMDKDFKPYVKLVENKKCLDYKVLKEFHSTKFSTKVENSTSLKMENRLIEHLEKELEEQKAEVKRLQGLYDEEHAHLLKLTTTVGTTLQTITQEQLASKLIEGQDKLKEEEVSPAEEPPKKGLKAFLSWFK